MKASICMAVKNAESTIYDALSSVQNQVYEDFEVIIVDDHSTDNTCNIILNSFVKKDPRFKLYVNLTDPNNPYVDAHNKSYEYSTGEYLLRFDSDDIMINNHVLTIIDYMENNPDIDAVCTIPIHVEKENNKIKEYDFNKITEEKIRNFTLEAIDLNNNDNINEHIGYSYITNLLIWFNQASCIRSSFYKNHDIKYESYRLGDHIFTWRLLANGANLKRIAKNTLYYNCHNNSISHSKEFYQATINEQLLLAKYKKEYFDKQDKTILYPNGLSGQQMYTMFNNTEVYFKGLIDGTTN